MSCCSLPARWSSRGRTGRRRLTSTWWAWVRTATATPAARTSRSTPSTSARLVDRWRELEEVVQKSRFAIPQSLPDALRYAADLAEQKALVEVERDRAIATKAEIGSRREATAMATASTAARKAAQLEEELGRGCRQATVLAVEKATGALEDSIKWQPLKQWCKDHGVVAEDVPCSRFGKAKAWPAGAWAEVYCVISATIFRQERL